MYECLGLQDQDEHGQNQDDHPCMVAWCNNNIDHPWCLNPIIRSTFFKGLYSLRLRVGVIVKTREIKPNVDYH